ASSGRRPRLSMNADTLALAAASSPAMSTSMLRPWASTWPKIVLNAFTTCALAGAALATSCAAEVPSGVVSPSAVALKGLAMSTMTLPASASPYRVTTGTALAYGTARMTMPPAGTAPGFPAVAPSPSALTMASPLAVSRLMTSTTLPPLTARVAMALAMFPEPMMLMLLMMGVLLGLVCAEDGRVGFPRTQGSGADQRDVELKGDLVAYQHAASLQGEIGGHAEVPAIDDGLALEASPQVAVRVLGRALVLEVNRDRVGHALDRQVPGEVEAVVAHLFRRGTGEGDLGELVHGEKVVAAQVGVALGVAGVDAVRLDHELRPRLRRGLLVEVDLSLDLGERAAHLRHHGVAGHEADASVGRVDDV